MLFRSPNVKVAECPRSPCSGTFRDRIAEVVDFQAFVITRAGSKTTILGRSRKTSVVWSKPAPTPAAVPGHYVGRSSQNA